VEEIKAFLLDNWQFLVSCLVSIILLIITCCKKRINLSLSDDVYSMIPSFINEAEVEYGDGHGSEKLQFVLKKCLIYLNTRTGISNATLTSLIPGIVNYIEEVLRTPTKKEDKK